MALYFVFSVVEKTLRTVAPEMRTNDRQLPCKDSGLCVRTVEVFNTRLKPSRQKPTLEMKLRHVGVEIRNK